MADSTINIELAIGLYAEVLLEVEVQWHLTPIGELVIDDFYAYHTASDSTGHTTHERIPYWMHKLVAVELEEYHDTIVNNME